MRLWTFILCCALTLLATALGICPAADGKAGQPIRMPSYRIETPGFDASEADIRAVLDSAGGELWRYFPDYKLEPIVVTRGQDSPITLFQRNERGEIVVRLNTEKTAWCQYSYQFGHEFCHVLCGFKPGYEGNKWFEETLCETASLFVMRGMSRTWKTSPPFPNWKDYRDSLRDYTDDIIRKRDLSYEIYVQGLPGFYHAHKATLEKESCSRELNGAMSLVFLQLFEERPERWEAVRWLNSAPAPQGETFDKYFKRWHGAVPKRHKPFVEKVAALYGISVA